MKALIGHALTILAPFAISGVLVLLANAMIAADSGPDAGPARPPLLGELADILGRCDTILLQAEPIQVSDAAIRTAADYRQLRDRINAMRARLGGRRRAGGPAKLVFDPRVHGEIRRAFDRGATSRALADGGTPGLTVVSMELGLARELLAVLALDLDYDVTERGPPAKRPGE